MNNCSLVRKSQHISENDEFRSPTEKDEALIKGAIGRAIRALVNQNYTKAIDSLKLLEMHARQVKHEAVSPEFLDFLYEKDLWSWIHNYRGQTPSHNEFVMLELLVQELLFLASNKLFAI